MLSMSNKNGFGCKSLTLEEGCQNFSLVASHLENLIVTDCSNFSFRTSAKIGRLKVMQCKEIKESIVSAGEKLELVDLKFVRSLSISFIYGADICINRIDSLENLTLQQENVADAERRNSSVLVTNSKFRSIAIKGRGRKSDVAPYETDIEFKDVDCIDAILASMNIGSLSLCFRTISSLNISDLDVSDKFSVRTNHLKHENLRLDLFSIQDSAFSGAAYIAGFNSIKKFSITNSKFEGTTEFSNMTFLSTPDFSNTDFYPISAMPTEKSFDIFDTENNDTILELNKLNLLKQIASKKMDRRFQADIFAVEQKYRRARKIGSRSERLFSYLYDKTSNYGRSILLPVVWIILMVFASAICLGFLELYSKQDQPVWSLSLPIDWQIISNSAANSLSNTFLPFRFLTQNLSEYGSHSLFFLAISFLQSLFSVFLLAMFAIAVRWNFKRD